ncbi:MAG: VOC family protein [Myxococcota bacterium]|jgi:catechol 2,3-dioxygenase-like lactoylglutathione lyase family enzyme
MTHTLSALAALARAPGARRWLRAYAAFSIACKLLLAFAAVAHAEAPAQVSALSRVGFTVSDLDASVKFFTEVLDFERVSERELAGDGIERASGVFAARVRIARLRLGSDEIELTEYLAPSNGRAFPERSRGNDLWFQHIAIVVSDMDAAYAKLRAQRVRHASSGPQRLPDWNPNAGGIEAFYFRDPDGHFLELIHFPLGKGDPRWQDARGTLFLGIDHTAIAVRDSEASLAFYRDVLGLRVAGASENYGTEQEHLNAVFGARLRITALRAGSGPGVELLEYLAPSDGLPRPADARANDLLFWQTDLLVSHAGAAERALRNADAALDSPGAVDLPGIGRVLTAADPDGHRIRLIEGATR